ncbi:hypothetical protein [Vibrio mexicanus]|uniref:hypothetical protein n=1 Tax=Vibrio mexicanus TaxID=1004326 RepID=UPI001EE1CD26|nr:hypothetical protein [Vibrio mexicanus]
MKYFLAGVLTMILMSSPSWACSYDGQFSNPFTESYPGALDVAIATQKAIRTSAISKPSELTGSKGLRRASWWISLMVEQYQRCQVAPISILSIAICGLSMRLENESLSMSMLRIRTKVCYCYQKPRYTI